MTTTDTQQVFIGSEVDQPKPSDGDQRFWSVTTIIGCLDKPALQYWAAEMAAKEAVRIAGSLKTRVEEDGEEATIKHLRDARFRKNKDERTATELGTAVHAACEEYALTGVRPVVDDEVRPFLERFDEWVQVFQPSYQAVEMAVYNPTYGYAGTCDAFLTIDGVRMIADYKSSRKSVDSQGKQSGPYPEIALQLAAYRHAELAAVFPARRFERFRRRYYLLSDAERELSEPVPEVDSGLGIYITPEHCTAYPIKCDQEVFESFLYVIEAARWANEMSKHVIGSPLTKGGI